MDLYDYVHMRIAGISFQWKLIHIKALLFANSTAPNLKKHGKPTLLNPILEKTPKEENSNH